MYSDAVVTCFWTVSEFRACEFYMEHTQLHHYGDLSHCGRIFYLAILPSQQSCVLQTTRQSSCVYRQREQQASYVQSSECAIVMHSLVVE